MSNANLPIDSLLKMNASFIARVEELAAQGDVASSARADAAISSLDLLRLERELRLKANADFDVSETAADWRERVGQSIASASNAIEAVEAEIEQDYLRRIMIAAILELAPRQGAFAWEQEVDAALDKIADDDERQSALYPYALYLASRLIYLDDPELTEYCRKIDRLADELQDAYEYEHVVGALTAGAANSFLRQGRFVPVADALEDVEGLDAPELKLETEEGLLRFYNELALEDLDDLDAQDYENRLDDAYRGLKASIARIEKTIETGVRIVTDEGEEEEEELDESEVDEVRLLLNDLAIANPSALKDGEYARAFVQRHQAFNTIEKTLAILAEASRTVESADASVSARAKAFYRGSADFYASEREKWFALALELTQNAEPTLERDALAIQADRAAALGRMEFLYGDEERGKTAVRLALGAIPKLDEPSDRIAAYKSLTETHLTIKKIKPAKKLLDAMDAEIGKIDELLMFEHKKIEALPLYLRLCGEDRVDEILESLETDPVRLRQTLRVQAAYAVKAYQASGDLDALNAELDEIVEKALENESRSDPVVAAAAFRELAVFTAERF